MARDMTEVIEAIKDGEPRKPETCERIEKSDDLSIVYYGSEIRTVDQLLEHAEIDLRIWEVAETKVNNWEVAGKRSLGQDGSKRWLGDTLWKTGLRQISVKLKRRAPKPIQEAIRELAKEIKPLAPIKKQSRKCTSSPHLLEIGIYDHHFGKLCWGEETGTNYDLRIAEQEFRHAIDQMFLKTAGFNIDLIVLPVGNDFFHVNDWLGQTSNGTRVEAVDDRFSKVFKLGCRSLQYALESALKIADVQVEWVPGNHDRHTSWFLLEFLSAKFSGEPRLKINNGPRERKYLRYGKTLIGYVHGDEMPHRDLATLMPTEAKDDWSQTEYHVWHVGHWHKKKETRYTAGDTFHGVEVRVMPSLCGTDAWHYRKGFTGNPRMAECWLWSREEGPVGHFIVNAQEQSR